MTMHGANAKENWLEQTLREKFCESVIAHASKWRLKEKTVDKISNSLRADEIRVDESERPNESD